MCLFFKESIMSATKYILTSVTSALVGAGIAFLYPNNEEPVESLDNQTPIEYTLDPSDVRTFQDCLNLKSPNEFQGTPFILSSKFFAGAFYNDGLQGYAVTLTPLGVSDFEIRTEINALSGPFGIAVTDCEIGTGKRLEANVTPTGSIPEQDEQVTHLQLNI